MDVFTIAAVIALALGVIALHVRLSPLQDLVDERAARRRAGASRQDAEAAEGTALLFGLRKLHGDYAELVRLERATSAVSRRELNAKRPAPLPKLGDDNGEDTSALSPPKYAARARVEPSTEPLAHPDLIGSEDIADEATRPSLGPDEETPPRPRRRPMLLEAYRGSDEGSAS
jgi:hypothetical protein